jgi:hypothetical protein
MFEALRYKPEGRGFDSRWCHWNFSLTVILLTALWPWVDSSPSRNEYQEYFLGVKVRRTDNFNTFMYRLPWNLGASTSWNPQGLSRPVQGLLYLLFVGVSKFKFPETYLSRRGWNVICSVLALGSFWRSEKYEYAGKCNHIRGTNVRDPAFETCRLHGKFLFVFPLLYTRHSRNLAGYTQDWVRNLLQRLVNVKSPPPPPASPVINLISCDCVLNNIIIAIIGFHVSFVNASRHGTQCLCCTPIPNVHHFLIRAVSFSV